jgi:putative membrane protein
MLAVTVSWWCTALEAPWEWTWRPYPGVWAAVLLPIVFYFGAKRRRQPRDSDSRRQTAFFLIGMAVFWIASDWPLGTLGAGYLASAHMLQYVLYTLVAAPFLLLGTPEWMGRRFLARIRAYRAVRWLAGSLLASGIVYNVLLVSTHAPVTVDALRTNALGSFAMDMVWLLSGLVLWTPILARLPEFTRHSPPAKIAYLFATTAIIAIIPASFMTLGEFPLYSTYELAPRFYNLSAVNDQQIAGLIMKVGTIPIIWVTMAAMWIRWANTEAGTPSHHGT